MGADMHRTSCTRCLNLLLTYPEGCRANCAYCGLARHREAERNYADRNFIRVDWPAVPYYLVDPHCCCWWRRRTLPPHAHRHHPPSALGRLIRGWCCESVVERAEHVPVFLLSNQTTMTRLDVQDLRDIGADIFTVALDACNPEVFNRIRGSGVQSPHSWDKYWEILCAAAGIFGPERFGAHPDRRHGRKRLRCPHPGRRRSGSWVAIVTCSRFFPSGAG